MSRRDLAMRRRPPEARISGLLEAEDTELMGGDPI